MVSGQCSSTRARKLRKGLELAGPSVAMEPAKMEMQQLLDFYLKGFLVRNAIELGDSLLGDMSSGGVR